MFPYILCWYLCPCTYVLFSESLIENWYNPNKLLSFYIKISLLLLLTMRCAVLGRERECYYRTLSIKKNKLKFKSKFVIKFIYMISTWVMEAVWGCDEMCCIKKEREREWVLWGWMPFSTIFQLYHGGQIPWWNIP